MNIIAVVGKSGSGKSSLMLKLASLFPDIFHVVTSYTTRECRTNDPNDINTHVFVDMDFYNKVEQPIAIYHSPLGYKSWVDKTSFKEDKINIYAIDVIALNNELQPFCNDNNWNLSAIYLMVNDEERKKRFLKREGNLDKFSNEEHLDLWHLTDMSDLHLVNVSGDEFSAFANFINSVKNIKKSIDF
ncbi:MAG: hypothetical protein ACRCX2_11270 [Paraclostridium sp.]